MFTFNSARRSSARARRIRRIATIAAPLCLTTALLTACSSGASASSSGGGATTGGKTYTVRWAEQWDDTFPVVIADKAMAKEITKKSQGHIKFKFYLNGSLGGTDGSMKSIENGSVEFVSIGSAHLNEIAPSTNAVYLPFLFSTSADALKAMAGPAGDTFQKQATSHGVHILTWYEGGFNEVCNNVRPITTPADAQHIQIRSQPGPIFDLQYKAMGMNPQPIDWTELYTALQNKTVDGYDVPLSATLSVKLPEVTKYCSMTNDGWGPSNALVSTTFLKSLPKNYQDIITNAAKSAQTDEAKNFASVNKQAVQQIKAAGVKINNVPASTIATWKKEMAPVYDYAKKQYGDQLIKELQKQ